MSPVRKRRRPLPLAPRDPTHGTRHGYLYYHCRCEPCKGADREYREARKSERAEARSKGIPPRRAAPPPPGDPGHGTLNSYVNRACRCEPCKDAGRAYRAAHRAAQGLPPAPPPPAEHGTVNSYVNRKCRCEPCREAIRAYRAARKARQQLNAPPDDAVTA